MKEITASEKSAEKSVAYGVENWWILSHPFTVWGPHGFVAMFSNLKCAARTVSHYGAGWYVEDENTAQVYQFSHCMKYLHGDYRA